MHASEIAYKAADYIEQNGHMKHQLAADPFNHDGNFGSACLRGAIRITMGDKPMMHIFEAPPETETIICKQIIKDYKLASPFFDNDDVGNVCADWNNDDERTADDVICALRKAGDNLAVAA